MREYLVTPALVVYHSKYDGMSEKVRGKMPEQPSLADVRYDRVLDSGVAGVLAGGTLSGFLRRLFLLPNATPKINGTDATGGRGTIPRAGLTAGVVTALLQLTVNQFRIVRLQLLARRSQPAAESDTPSTVLPLPSSLSTQSGFDVGLRASLENPGVLPPTPAEESQTLPGKMIRGLSTFLPVRKLSDEDYLALLVKKRNEVDRRLKEIEEEEWRIFQSAQSVGEITTNA